jgi:hypothetical protein
VTSIKEYWCWFCHAYRKHRMVTEEKGYCAICDTVNYAPMGDVD